MTSTNPLNDLSNSSPGASSAATGASTASTAAASGANAAPSSASSASSASSGIQPLPANVVKQGGPIAPNQAAINQSLTASAQRGMPPVTPHGELLRQSVAQTANNTQLSHSPQLANPHFVPTGINPGAHVGQTGVAANSNVVPSSQSSSSSIGSSTVASHEGNLHSRTGISAGQTHVLSTSTADDSLAENIFSNQVEKSDDSEALSKKAGQAKAAAAAFRGTH